MTRIDWAEVEELFGSLPLRQQMLLLERLHRKMRETAYPDIDPDGFERALDEMANDPAVVRELGLLAAKEPK
jgi:hypothetical protein